MKLKFNINKMNDKQKDIAKIILSIIIIDFIIELLNQNIILTILPNRLIFNFILIGLVYLFFICITNKIKLSIIISNILLFGIGFANYSVMSLRGTPLSLLDVLSINTGLTIADTYTLIINGYLIAAVIAFIALIIINFKTDYKYKFNKTKNDIIIII